MPPDGLGHIFPCSREAKWAAYNPHDGFTDFACDEHVGPFRYDNEEGDFEFCIEPIGYVFCKICGEFMNVNDRAEMFLHGGDAVHCHPECGLAKGMEIA